MIQKRKGKVVLGLNSRIFKYAYARFVGKPAQIVPVCTDTESGNFVNFKLRAPRKFTFFAEPT
jgi:hypothetical protein